MTDRRTNRNALLTVAGALIGGAALFWSTGSPEIEIPARPAAVTVQTADISYPEEPLPAIRVPDLEPHPAVGSRSPGTEISIPARPTLMLADLTIERPTEPFPAIVVPDLDRPWSSSPRTFAV